MSSQESAVITQICARLGKKDALIGAREIRVAVALALGTDKKTGCCNWRQDRLAARAGMTREQFSKGCASLAAAGFLDIQQRGKKLSNHYRLITREPVWIVIATIMDRRCRALDLRLQVAAAACRHSVARHDRNCLIFDRHKDKPGITLARWLGTTRARVIASLERQGAFGLLKGSPMPLESLGSSAGEVQWLRDEWCGTDIGDVTDIMSTRFLLLRWGPPGGAVKEAPAEAPDVATTPGDDAQFGSHHVDDSGQGTTPIQVTSPDQFGSQPYSPHRDSLLSGESLPRSHNSSWACPQDRPNAVTGFEAEDQFLRSSLLPASSSASSPRPPAPHTERQRQTDLAAYEIEFRAKNRAYIQAHPELFGPGCLDALDAPNHAGGIDDLPF